MLNAGPYTQPIETAPEGALQRLRIHSSGRLHFGFADLGNTTGRQFGSIGLSLTAPAQEIVFERQDGWPSGRVTATGPEHERVIHYLEKTITSIKLDVAIKAQVHKALPAHSGLGSGTQIALACGSAACSLAGHQVSLNELGAKLQRGARSGVGIAGFQHGGFIVDGGRDADTQVPPMTVRHPFPESWPVVLVIDDEHQGLADGAEREAFAGLPVFPKESSGEICRLILLKMLPALTEHNLAGFASAVSRVQAIIGDFFAPFQGGGRFTSAAVETACDTLMQHGALGAGQSSWGPTGYAFFDEVDRAERAIKALKATLDSSRLRVMLTTANNQGAQIRSDLST